MTAVELRESLDARIADVQMQLTRMEAAHQEESRKLAQRLVILQRLRGRLTSPGNEVLIQELQDMGYLI